MLVKQQLKTDAILLLQQLIATPSFSKEELETADLIAVFFTKKKHPCFENRQQRLGSGKTLESGPSHHPAQLPPRYCKTSTGLAA